jgi:hypothetical protein
MKVTKRFSFLYSSLLFFSCGLNSYHLPQLSLGLTNILSGGPLIPVEGWYWLPYFVDYHTTKLLDGCGNLLGGVPSPHFNGVSIINQFVYQSELEFLRSRIGFSFVLPAVVSSRIEKNNLGIVSSGAGLADFLMGLFLQWKAVAFGNESHFIHRLGCDASFPSGKNEQPCKTINPGNNFYYLRPYWSGTLYFTNKLAGSWTLYYLWCTRNKATCIQPGSAISANYDIAYQVLPKFWVGFTGYFLEQLRDSRLLGTDIPNSRERILGSGCGFLYTTRRRFSAQSWTRSTLCISSC